MRRAAKTLPTAAVLIVIAALAVSPGSAAGAQELPVIQSVAFTGSQDGSVNPTVTIVGSGFLPQPTALPAICGGSLSPGIQLHFGVKSETSGGFNAGAADNLLGISVSSYTDTNIEYQFGSALCGYPTFGKVAQGETFTVDVNGASCSGTVDYTAPVQCGGAPPDTAPPVLDLPTEVVVDAVNPAGAPVTYIATATDDDGLSYPVDCSPASHSTFPIGMTSVDCQATDAASNTALGSFQVTVKGAGAQLADLLAEVQDLGPGRSLTAKLKNAIARLQAGNTRAACGALVALTNEVRAQSGKSLSVSLADALSADAGSRPWSAAEVGNGLLAGT
jgi:HYR domain